MAESLGTIDRRTSEQPLVVDSNGTRAYAEWTLKARSRVHALARMRTIGVFRGAVYKEIDNSVPDPFLMADRISVGVWDSINEQTQAGLGIYHVVTEYKPINNSVGGDEIEVDGSPVWTTEEGLTDVEIDSDIHGVPIVNTAQVPIEGVTAPEPTEFQIVEWIRSNENYFKAVKFSRQYRGKTNKSAFKGADPREVLCHGFKPQALDRKAFSGGGLIKYTARLEFSNSRRIRTTVLRGSFGPDGIRFRPVGVTKIPGFSKVLLSQGKVELNPLYDHNDVANYKKRHRLRPIMMTDEAGVQHPVSEPVLLSAAGNFVHRDEDRKPFSILVEGVEEEEFNNIGI